MIYLIIAAQQTGLQLLDKSKTTNLPRASTNDLSLQKIISNVLIILGAVAVLMMVIAGLRYILSGGDATKAADARRQIIHIAAGLVIIGLAWTIVSVALGKASG